MSIKEFNNRLEGLDIWNMDDTVDSDEFWDDDGEMEANRLLGGYPGIPESLETNISDTAMDESNSAHPFLAYTCGIIIAVMLHVICSVISAFSVSFLVYLVFWDVAQEFPLWMIVIGLVVGLPIHVGTAWLTAFILYHIRLGLSGKIKYYNVAAGAAMVSAFMVMAVLSGGTNGLLMHIIHAECIRHFGKKFVGKQLIDKPRHEPEQQPEQVVSEPNDREHIVIVPTAVVIPWVLFAIALLGGIVYGTIQYSVGYNKGMEAVGIAVEDKTDSVGNKEDSHDERVFETPSEEFWYNRGYYTGYEDGRAAGVTGESYYYPYNSNTESGSKQESLYRDGYDEGYKEGHSDGES